MTKPDMDARLVKGPDARLRLTALSTIAGILVEEVSQPITAATNYIHGSVRQLRDQGGVDEELLAMIEHAALEVVKAGEIVRRMHDFIASGKLSGRTESLTAIVESAGAHLVCPDGVEARIETAIDPDADRVTVDRILIEHVFSILFANACERFVGPDRRITITASRLCGKVGLRVQDSGPAFTDYDFIHLFEPLFTAKTATTGLQMPVCRTIVEAHGGELWAERAAADGPGFSLTLPAAD
jgi:C4-dicarboxylate-specific signal transduction histidine kinase